MLASPVLEEPGKKHKRMSIDLDSSCGLDYLSSSCSVVQMPMTEYDAICAFQVYVQLLYVV